MRTERTVDEEARAEDWACDCELERDCDDDDFGGEI
jgi:hypothetical protein